MKNVAKAEVPPCVQDTVRVTLRDTPPSREMGCPNPLCTTGVTIASNAVEPNERGAWRQRTACTLFYCSAGAVQIKTRRGLWLATRHRAVWLPANESHMVIAVYPATLKTLEVPIRTDRSVLARCGAADISSLVKRLLERLESCGASNQAAHAGLLSLLANEIGSSFTSTLSVPLPKNRDLLRLCAHVAETADGDLRQVHLAQVLGKSLREMRCCFFQECGISTIEWIRQWKLIKAVAGIEAGLPIRSVASSTGFRSASAFGAMFRRALGTSPSGFRR